MESLFDNQSLTTSSSTPHTPSPRLDGQPEMHFEYPYHEQREPQQQQQQPPQQPQQSAQSAPPPPPYWDTAKYYDGEETGLYASPPSNSSGYLRSDWRDNGHGDTHTHLYRRASFPFVNQDQNQNNYRYEDSSHYDPDSVKLEQAPPVVVPTQFYRPSSSSSDVSSVSAPPSSYVPPMSAIPIMHTDDAASKETQYLRRKCFNCQTTEPPSWRRSTLNPGKIVCNKCGLYERTHNKPRPHQFGLRPGNKTRKAPVKPHGQSPTSSSPKARHTLSLKKEPLDYSHPMRRGSIASINSGSGTSDWDDHSGYSTGSSVYPSPMGIHHSYNSMPPPRSNGIRLPQAPMLKVPSKSSTPPASSSAPTTPYGSMYGHRGPPVPPSADYYARRGSLGIPPSHHAHTAHEMGSAHVNMMRRPSLGMLHAHLPPPSSWHPPPPVPLSEMSIAPPVALSSADSTPRGAYLSHTPPPASPVAESTALTA